LPRRFFLPFRFLVLSSQRRPHRPELQRPRGSAARGLRGGGFVRLPEFGSNRPSERKDNARHGVAYCRWAAKEAARVFKGLSRRRAARKCREGRGRQDLAAPPLLPYRPRSCVSSILSPPPVAARRVHTSSRYGPHDGPRG
jgi:hypothetical protein